LVQDIKSRCEEQNITNVKIKCVVVSAKGGKEQCLWANEFALAGLEMKILIILF